MEPLDAAIAVLRDAGEPLHWTVIQDRALRQGLIDPFVVSDVRTHAVGGVARRRPRGRAGTRGDGRVPAAGGAGATTDA